MEQPTQQQTPSAAKVLLFRSQGPDMLREAMAAGVLMPEVNQQIASVVADNERLRAENESLRELTITQRNSIIAYRSRAMERYSAPTPERTIPQTRYYAAVLSAVSFLVTTSVLTIAYISTLL